METGSPTDFQHWRRTQYICSPILEIGSSSSTSRSYYHKIRSSRESLPAVLEESCTIWLKLVSLSTEKLVKSYLRKQITSTSHMFHNCGIIGPKLYSKSFQPSSRMTESSLASRLLNGVFWNNLLQWHNCIFSKKLFFSVIIFSIISLLAFVQNILISKPCRVSAFKYWVAHKASCFTSKVLFGELLAIYTCLPPLSLLQHLLGITRGLFQARYHL